MTRIHTVFVCFIAAFLAIQATQAQDTKENADFKLALNLYNDKLYDLAADQFRQFVAAYPNTQQGIEARFYIGLALMKLNKFDEARTQFQNFAVSYPQHPKAADAWWQTGEAYAALGNAAEAASAFERLKVFYPASRLAPDALIQASEYFLQASNAENAKKVLRALIQEYSTSQSVMTARLRLGSILAKEGNAEQARAEFKRVLDGPIADLKAEALVALGTLNASTGRVEEAEKDLREAISTYPKSASAPAGALALGTLYRQQGNFEAAASLLKKVVDDSSVTDTTIRQAALREYGATSLRQHDLKTALSSFDTFLQKFPSSPAVPSILLSAGEASAGNGELQRSDRYLKQIQQRYQSSPELRIALVRLEENAAVQKHYRDAVSLSRQFVAAYPSDGAAPQLLIAAARIAEDSLGDAPVALELYREIAASYTSSEFIDDALYGIARCTESTSAIEKAIAAYRDVLRQYTATEFADVIDHHIDSLQTYALKDREGGLEKLARLMSDVIAQQSRADLSCRLADIYFTDLKDYASAAAQYANALTQGLTDSLTRRHAALHRARSLKFLAVVDERASDEAMKAYDEFLSQYPASPEAPEAAIERGLIHGGTLTDAGRLIEQLPSPELRISYALKIADRAIASAAYDSAVRILQPFMSDQEALFLTARALEAEGLKDSASAFYARYAELFPNQRHTAVALNREAERALQEGKTADVLSCCDRILTSFYYTPSARDAELRKAEALRRAGNTREAIAEYLSILRRQQENAMTAESSQPDIVFALAGLYASKGDSVRAKDYYREYLTIDPAGSSAVDALTALGNYARDEGNLELAASFFKRASQLNGGASSRRAMADLLYQSGNYSEAMIEYTSLMEQSTDAHDKEFYEARIIIAQYRTNAIAEAERRTALFKKAYPKDDEQIAELVLERGVQYFKKQDYQKSRKAFDEILDDYDETASAPAALYWNGLIAEAVNKNEDAIKILDDVIRRFPDAPIVQRARLSLGDIYFRKEQYEKAISYYRTIVDSSTDAEILPYALNNIIVAYKQVGINDAALQLTRKFISLYPNDATVTDKRVDIGILYEKLGYYDQAIIHFQQLLDEANSDLEAEIRYYLGECYYNQTHYQQAILEFLKVPYLITKKTKIDWTPNAFYMSGQSYEKMGKYDQAIGMYQQIIDRPGIDQTFKAAAEKEIGRVRDLIQQGVSK